MATSTDIINRNPGGLVYTWQLSVQGFGECVGDPAQLEHNDEVAVIATNDRVRIALADVEAYEEAINLLDRADTSGNDLGDRRAALLRTVADASDFTRSLAVVRRFSEEPPRFVGEAENPNHAMYWAARQQLEDFNAHR